PSSGTSGRKSGGMTGRTSSTIQSGRACDEAKPCTSFKRFASFLRICLLFAILDFVQELRLGQRRLARIDHDVILVIDHALELPRAHIEHEAKPRWHAFVEPDVR